MQLVGILLAGCFMIFFGASAHALSPPVIDPTIEPDAGRNILISSYYGKRGETFVELFNNTEAPIDISGWSVRFISATSESDVTVPDGWLLGDTYVSLSENSLVSGVLGYPALTLPPLMPITNVQVLNTDGLFVSEVAGFPADITSKWYQRKSTGMSGVFSNDFSAATASTKLRHTPLYSLPVVPPLLRIVEIYPHASNCSPTYTGILCGDYVKLYNPSSSAASTAGYRLRSDSSTSESSNAFHLDAHEDVLPGAYLTVSLRDDGDKMSLTDDSGWVWLEDSAGIVKYPETVVSYPSASSSTKIGHAWALIDDTWQWSSTPMPGAANALPVASLGGEVLAETVDCPQGKYRNPETNRCRNIEDAIATLVACDEGQTRNPATNRCRSVASASVTLVPCAVGQERNPETNRCRSVTSSESVLVPCLAGQERNPETNRCRKTILDAALSPASISPASSDTAQSPLVWLLAGIVGVGAVGYGMYEWRSELVVALRKVAARVSPK